MSAAVSTKVLKVPPPPLGPASSGSHRLGSAGALSRVPMGAFIALFCVLWSYAFVASKISVMDCPPFIMLSARFLLAGLVVFGVVLWRRQSLALPARDIAAFAVLGLANQAIYLGLSYEGFKTVSAGLGALIVSANPVATAVLAALLLHEPLTWRKVAGLMLGIAGVASIVWHRVELGSDSLYGVVLMLGALVSLVGGTILFKLLAPKGDLLLGVGVQNIAAGVVLIPFALMSNFAVIVPSARLLGAFVFLVFGGSILGYLIWFHMLKEIGASRASAWHFVMPPLGMLFAWLVLGEHLALRDLMGIVPVALGVYLVTRQPAVHFPEAAK